MEKQNLNGWISLHRKIKNHWLWNEPRKFSKLEAWLDMLTRANWERRWWTKGNRWVERGHYIDSELQMVRRWGWARKTVQRFLARMESEEMIRRIPFDKQYTEIEIVNFDKYQDKENNTDIEVYNEVVKEVVKKVDKEKPCRSKDKPELVVKQVAKEVVNDVVITNNTNKLNNKYAEMDISKTLDELVKLYRETSPLSIKQYGKSGIFRARDCFEAAIKKDGANPAELARAIAANPEQPPWKMVQAVTNRPNVCNLPDASELFGDEEP